MESAGRDAVFFVSDAHFGLDADERERVARFSELSALARERASELYIVGDLFDFWIEYRRAIRPDYFAVLHELRGLVEAGVRVCYVAGNHDFALGEFLEKRVGLTLHRGCVDAEIQGRRVHISHGDRVNRSGAHKLAAALLSNRFLQSAYRLIHPDIGVRIGEFLSSLGKTNRRNAGMTAQGLEKYRRAARARLLTGQSDLVVFAHTHYGEILRFSEGEYCNIGSWMDRYDYAVMRGGKIQLLKWGSSAS
jgi:UDP-2,3-diacylglucosamine hydrolase